MTSPRDPVPSQAPPSPPSVVSPFLPLRIIWGALLFTVVLYVGIAFFVPMPARPAADASPPLDLMFAIAALGSLGASYFVPPILIKQLVKNLDGAPPSEQKLAALLMSPWIVRLALCESAAIIGLALAFISQQPVKILPFAALSALTLLMAFPSETALRRAIER